mgnify:CR=1
MSGPQDCKPAYGGGRGEIIDGLQAETAQRDGCGKPVGERQINLATNRVAIRRLARNCIPIMTLGILLLELSIFRCR